ncbi:hypothetical protein HYFRA_00011871 [Hymenoscyphus fraxineus]|uniref:Sulfatase N-terminal domain-containing protein n=1 Tax=Hymenoscyphus fraxineus TaxID=746836 RepID=A0A9N9L1Z0_9HELO|nr:hypothetical protein HYFRA_00011871 [Hymenoscyphus fraxineus]
MSPAALDFRQLFRPPFQYSLLIITATTPKVLHLYSHLSSLPPLLYLLYLPTFLALDLFNGVVFWALVHLTSRGGVSVLLTVFRCALCLILLGASSAWISFFLETGGEIKWGAAKNVAKDPAGLKVLASGGTRALLAAIALVVLARIVSQPLYNGTENLFAAGLHALSGGRWGIRKSYNEDNSSKLDLEEGPQSSSAFLSVESDHEYRSSSDADEARGFLSEKEAPRPSFWSRWIARAKFLVPMGTVLVLLLVRPRHFPFGHMSNSLPYTLYGVFNKPTDEACLGSLSGDFPPFPLPDLVAEVLWEPAKGEFPGWEPRVNRTFDKSLTRPQWLPTEPVHGFERWYNESMPKGSHGGDGPPQGQKNKGGFFTKGINYDPITDPLRISNLDQGVLDSIALKLKDHKVTIKHVVLLSLESTRKDVFPLEKGSHLHQIIEKSHSSNFTAAEANVKLAELTKNAETLTGEANGFGIGGVEYPSARAGSWRNPDKGSGGLNIQGALTGSTTSLKSIIGSHCGVHPLPVDFTVEVRRQIYQPCIPSILELFNNNKPRGESHPGSAAKRDDMQSQLWKPVFVQAMTDQYDHQDRLLEHMGFKDTIVRDTLLDPSSPHQPTEKEVNYFGFPEDQVKPYMRDLFEAAKEKNERLFMSHFTSTTHHPWALPEDFGELVDYLEPKKWSEGSLNKYLNTVKYVDGWIGEIMDLLEDVGVADETLVVMVGDHGWAFEEDAAFHGSFENGHISNMRVPLLFHHNSLPRIQLQVNATSTSILPTILDLLSTTSSLNKQDTDIAKNLVHQYEGQSLIRPFVPKKNGRQAWNIGILNAGGALLSVSSAAVPYRLVLPICRNGVYRFTDVLLDPNELHPIEDYSIETLAKQLRNFYKNIGADGEEAAKWISDAEKVGKWWVLEQRRKWRFGGSALQEDRKAEEMEGMGKVSQKKWWET